VAKQKQPATGISTDTGRYAICPNSNVAHVLIAKQVKRGPSGGMFFLCVCGFRGYYPKSQKTLPHTRDEVLKAGAIIPDELAIVAAPSPAIATMPPLYGTTPLQYGQPARPRRTTT
jgi:hypothetical protein